MAATLPTASRCAVNTSDSGRKPHHPRAGTRRPAPRRDGAGARPRATRRHPRAGRRGAGRSDAPAARPAGPPGTAVLASATTVPVGAMIRLAPSRVDVECEPAWLACTHHWLLVSADAGLQEVPGRRPLDLVGRRGQHQPGPAQRQRPRHLGEVAVEADDEPDAPERRVVERRQAVAGGEHRVLERGRVEMGLAVPGRQLAARVEDERRVVEQPVLAQLRARCRRPGTGRAGGPRRPALASAARHGPRRPPARPRPASRGRSRRTTARAARAARRRGRPRRRPCPGRRTGSGVGSPGAASHWATPTRRSRFTSIHQVLRFLSDRRCAASPRTVRGNVRGRFPGCEWTVTRAARSARWTRVRVQAGRRAMSVTSS